jgi:hypothetical protein
MMFDLYLIATPAQSRDIGPHIEASMIVDAEDRDAAISQRPEDWPLSRTRASKTRCG